MRIFTRLSAEYFFAIFLWKPIDFYLQDSIIDVFLYTNTNYTSIFSISQHSQV